MEKTFADGGKIAKFVKVFSLESFPLYGILTVSTVSQSLNKSAGERMGIITGFYDNNTRLGIPRMGGGDVNVTDSQSIWVVVYAHAVAYWYLFRFVLSTLRTSTFNPNTLHCYT